MTSRGIVPFDRSQIELCKDLAITFVKSGFFQDSRDAAQAMVKMMAGAELGLTPFAAMSSLNVVNGKVEISGNLYAAKIKSSGKYDYRIRESTPDRCTLEFFELVDGARESVGVHTFSMEDARRAGLSGNNWKSYPQAMLFNRAISSGAKIYCPDAVSEGAPVYVTGEISGADADFDGRALAGSATVVDAPPAANGNGLAEKLRRVAPDPAPSDARTDGLAMPEAATEQPPPEDAKTESAPSGGLFPEEPTTKADLLAAIRDLEDHVSPDAHAAACKICSVTHTGGIDGWSVSPLRRIYKALRSAMETEAASSGPYA